jgi:hypothetical protein
LGAVFLDPASNIYAGPIVVNVYPEVRESLVIFKAYIIVWGIFLYHGAFQDKRLLLGIGNYELEIPYF